MTARLIAALLAERSGYVARGLSSRVADVDAALAALGHGAPVETASIEPQIETAARKKPTRRKKG